MREDGLLLFRKALALPGRAVVGISTRRGLTRGEESEEGKVRGLLREGLAEDGESAPSFFRCF